MSDKPLVCVIDANVALKLFFVQPLSDAADALFAHLEADARARFYAPDFFYAECASAFVNYVRLMKYPPDDAKKDLAELYALALKVVPTADLASQALKIALAHRLIPSSQSRLRGKPLADILTDVITKVPVPV
ncbi:MAG: vapC9, partial [Anaerolineales bacterium]|nr:vapC9 [Anaerolineales bacterium]